MRKPLNRHHRHGHANRQAIKVKRVQMNRTALTVSKRILVVTLSGALLLQPLLPVSLTGERVIAAAATAQSPSLKLQEEVMITSGAKRLKYVWSSTRSNRAVQANVHVIEVDLSNRYVNLDVMSGKNGTVASKNTVTNMVAENGAVAGINADFFIMSAEGVGMGPQITSGALMTSPSTINGMYAFALDKNRVPTIDRYSFEGSVTSGSGASFPLAGVNQTSYTMDTADGTQRSHTNQLYMYTSAWAQSERPKNSGTTPTEVLVKNNVVMQIQENGTLPMSAPEDGYILRGHGDAAKFIQENLTVGQTVSSTYNLVSLVSGAKKDPASYQMMVGGHTLLVTDGKASAFTRDVTGVSGNSAVARTAIGYSKDNKKVYLITVERQGASSGMTLKELQNMMVMLGVWQGLNLDGGGSTTMAARPLGDFAAGLAHSTSNGTGTVQRAVANGLGIFTTAPQGQVKDVRASGPSTIFIGAKADYTIKGYDTYYNPIKQDNVTAAWSVPSAFGSFSGSTLTAKKAGTTQVTVKSDKATAKMDVEVIAGSQIDTMTVTPSSTALSAGTQISLPVKVKLTDGRELSVPAESIKWELQGMQGSVKDGKLDIQSVNTSVANAYAIARYDGFATMAAFSTTPSVNTKVWESFENVNYKVNFQGVPEQTAGNASIVNGFAERTGSALQITYDFTDGTGGRWAYALLGTGGKAVEGKPVGLKAAVYGDGSSNWLRAEVTDADGKTHYIDLVRPITWTGWKDIEVDFNGLTMAYPITVKKIYIANPESGQENRSLTGQVAIDDIQFKYASTITTPAASTIELFVGKKTATVSGQSTSLDAAPVIIKNTTYVPLRFVSDAVGGQVAWDNSSKRVTFLRGNKMLELWIGRKDVVLNGKRIKTEVSPIDRNGRTMVPVRLVSEQLGLKVNWDNSAQKVTIQ